MRPIKFRAWDEETETMYYSDQEYKDCFFGFNKGVVVAWLRQTEPQTRDEPAYDYGKPVDVMQFIDLKDKNGKEAYEDDVVKNCATGKIGKIVFSHIGNMDGWTGFWVNWGRTKAHWPVRGKEFEIIGNIHSNPELMSGEKE